MFYGIFALLFTLCCVSSKVDVPRYSPCSSEIENIRDEDVWITSPNFPGKYDTKVSCRWKIFSESTVILHITQLDISATENGNSDGNECAGNLQIYADGRQVSIGECVQKKDELLTDKLPIRKDDYDNVTVDIVFTSDHGYKGTGFSIFYGAEIPPKNCNYTRLGILCQRWDQEYPHKPHPGKLPKANDREHNFCRNPDNDFRGHWCYTVNPRVRWEYCNIDDCDGPYTPLVSFKQALWYPLLGVTGVITVVIIYICLRHRCKKMKTPHTQPVGMQTVAMVDIIDEKRVPTDSTKEIMLSSST